MSYEITGQTPMHSDTYYLARIGAPYSCAVPAIIADLERRGIDPFFDGGLFGAGTEAWAVSQVQGGFVTAFIFEVSTRMDAYTCAFNLAQAAIGVGVTPIGVAVMAFEQGEAMDLAEASRPTLPDFGRLPDAIEGGANAVKEVARIPLYLAIAGLVGLISYAYLTRAK